MRFLEEANVATIPFPFSGQPTNLDMSELPVLAKQSAAVVTPFRVLNALLTGTPSLDQLAQEVSTRQQSLGRKFNKVEAVYTLAPPVPPIAWRYECGQCRFFQPATNTCEVVGLRSDAFGGEAIHPLSWCAWWLPLANQPILAWVTQLIDPSRLPRR